MFMPHSAVVSAESVPTSQHAYDRLWFLEDRRGAKGGRLLHQPSMMTGVQRSTRSAIRAPRPSGAQDIRLVAEAISALRQRVMQKASVPKRLLDSDNACSSPIAL
jgi:hypothetical protein